MQLLSLISCSPLSTTLFLLLRQSHYDYAIELFFDLLVKDPLLAACGNILCLLVPCSNFSAAVQIARLSRIALPRHDFVGPRNGSADNRANDQLSDGIWLLHVERSIQRSLEKAPCHIDPRFSGGLACVTAPNSGAGGPAIVRRYDGSDRPLAIESYAIKKDVRRHRQSDCSARRRNR